MIMDALLRFSNQQALTSTTAPSENIIDLLNARDMGVGTPLRLAMSVDVAAVSAGGATLQVVAQGAPNSGGSPGSYENLAYSPAYTVANLALNQQLFPIDWPALLANINTLHRFLRLNYVIATSTFSALTVTSALVLDRQDWRSYPPGLAISN